MGKNKKEHRKKVAKRNERINEQRKMFKKAQEKMIMEMIKREQEQGKFDNNPTIPGVNGPSIIDGPTLTDGPQI